MSQFRRSLILDVGIRATFHTVLLFSVFLLFAGHNAPGGGFIGGLVAGAAFMLRYVGGGADEVERTERVAPETLIGSGVTISVFTALVPLVFGDDLLESAYRSFKDVPLLGSVSLTSVLAFDIGVYLVVVGLVIGVLRSLGKEEALDDDPLRAEGPTTGGTVG
jgi:multisubunit Na+/H+ antiporter MnhB subunit